ncbi:D-alanine--D-alanine ligase [Candidatus Fermentibacteria bacterium]|nr:D-alanine--D-alanine ligase [Candidatus Fermentibacteria bacterium]
MPKPTVAVIMGGRSSEREVSLVSGSAVARAIDRSRYDVMLVHVRQDGAWERIEMLYDHSHLAGTYGNAMDPARHRYHAHSDLSGLWEILSAMDMAFPLLHGPFGEDGTVHGFLETAGVPYVGGGVLFNSVCMHKPILKALLLHHGIPTPAFETVHAKDWAADSEHEAGAALEKLGLPVFVKPAALGSSIGITRVDDADGLFASVELALRYGPTVIIEKAVNGAREIECAVMGNDDPRAAGTLGEIVPRNRFYDYESKYVLDSQLFVPARDLSANMVRTIREMAVAAYRVADGAGYARVDFLMSGAEVMVNEINTIPGFTEISMFPRLFMAEGMTFSQIVDSLISYAWERFRRAASA